MISGDKEAKRLITEGTGEWKIGRDANGFISYIIRNGYVILSLVPGACRNETCAGKFVEHLNLLESVCDKIKEIE